MLRFSVVQAVFIMIVVLV